MKLFNGIFNGEFSIEREAVIIDNKGELSSKKVSSLFTETNPYIIGNLEESKIKIITSNCNSIDMAVNLLKDIQSVVISNLDDEYLWKQSNPPILSKTVFSKSSRVNFKFSFADEYLRNLYIETEDKGSFNDFKVKSYNKILKYLKKDLWFLDYLTNTSTELSIPIKVEYNKSEDTDYIEVQLDINPFTSTGISRIDLKYIHLYILYSLHQKDFEFNKEKQKISNEKLDKIKNNSIESLKSEMMDINNNIKIFSNDLEGFYDFKKIFKNIAERIIDDNLIYSSRLKELYSKSSFMEYNLSKAKEDKKIILEEPFKFYSYPKLELSTKILIKTAIAKGIYFEVLDENTNFITLKSPITNKVEFIQQATKTNLDKYANVLAMENKIVTKLLLDRNGVSIPKGFEVNSSDGILNSDLERFVNNGVVIKPNTTNFGEGITIFPEGASIEKIKEAIDFSLSKDDTVLIEPFIKGREYRFIVIDNEVVGVLHRRAANVIGDGKSTIEELVNEKNKNILRGTGYVTPLEKIKITKIEIDFLNEQGLNINSIPKKDEMIFLRENSNISTGGDSIDYTDEMHSSYKDITLKACDALGVNISGVDMIIEDITIPATPNNYSILELNFNPAIHIHTYPLVGKNRRPAEKILKALFK